MKKNVIKLIVVFSLLFGYESIMAQKYNIPDNWKIIKTVKGDLNKDGKDDAVLIVQKTDASKMIENKKNPNASMLNTNPRGIMIFFNRGGKYVLIEKNLNGFIPQEDNAEDPCWSDPFSSVEIKKNVLKIIFDYWSSCGSDISEDATYIFRYQHKGFELIGYGESSFSRFSGEGSKLSINFSTKKKSYTTGLNMIEGGGKPKTKWSNIKIDKLYRLKDFPLEIVTE